jgi:hypothetical protein
MPYIGNTTSSFDVNTNNINNGAVTTEKLASPIAPTVSSINGGPLAGARNRIINGDMRIDQRNAGASVTVGVGNGSLYFLDRFFAQNIGGSSAFTAQRSALSPALFTNSTLITTTTSSAPSAADSKFFSQYIEGFNVADFGWGTASAQTVTLSFWVRSSLTGSFGVGLANNAASRSYAAPYSIAAANTWEYKTIVIPGDITGTWATDNTTGLRLTFNIGSGSDWHQSTNAWGASGGGRGAFSGVTSLLATNGATFYITGVQLEAGTVATPFERRSYGQELALCQRYYETNSGVNQTVANGGSYAHVPFKVTKRASATVSLTLTLGTFTDLQSGSFGFYASFTNTNAFFFAASAEL